MVLHDLWPAESSMWNRGCEGHLESYIGMVLTAQESMPLTHVLFRRLEEDRTLARIPTVCSYNYPDIPLTPSRHAGLFAVPEVQA